MLLAVCVGFVRRLRNRNNYGEIHIENVWSMNEDKELYVCGTCLTILSDVLYISIYIYYGGVNFEMGMATYIAIIELHMYS